MRHKNLNLQLPMIRKPIRCSQERFFGGKRRGRKRHCFLILVIIRDTDGAKKDTFDSNYPKTADLPTVDDIEETVATEEKISAFY